MRMRWGVAATDIKTLAPQSARSIAVIDGVIYVGTTDARIYRLGSPR
jgi:hypothetical protein